MAYFTLPLISQNQTQRYKQAQNGPGLVSCLGCVLSTARQLGMFPGQEDSFLTPKRLVHTSAFPHLTLSFLCSADDVPFLSTEQSWQQSAVRMGALVHHSIDNLWV